MILKNLDKKFSNYYKTYYHQFDPLQLLQGMHRLKKRAREEGVCTYSYDSQQATEYYTDFLKPQKIHHKLIANLVAEQEIYGRIVWMRSSKSRRFSPREIRIAKAVSPYLAHALAYNELRARLEFKGKILTYIEKQSSMGILLLDEKLQIVYINQKAEEMFNVVGDSAANGSGGKQILSHLLKDCREIKQRLKGCPADFLAIPRKHTVPGYGHSRFAAMYKALAHGPGEEHSMLFMVCIEELPPHPEVDPQYLMTAYHLSKREIEVAGLLFAGLKNAQIAEKLFISEITVKKHLQNIYLKVGVNNRTSLINKMLTR